MLHREQRGARPGRDTDLRVDVLRLLAADLAARDELQDLVVNLLSREPSPDEATALIDQMEHFLSELNPESRKILELRMQGYSTLEISKQLNVTDRKIRRLMERIRALAEREELLPADGPSRDE